MHPLDRPETIKRCDKNNVLESLDEFSKQIRQAWVDTRGIQVPQDYRSVNSVVVSGMGGSRWPACILYDVMAGFLKIPMNVVSDYGLPGFIDERTMVLLSSYSGTTEEVLNTFKIAQKKRAKIIILTNGGPLAKLAKRNNIPIYVFEEKHNPSHQPRLGTGYMFTGMLGIFERTGLIDVTDKDVDKIIDIAVNFGQKWSNLSEFPNNSAKQLAVKIATKMPILIAAEHLESTTEAFRNRLNENAKHLAVAMPIPGLNHHFLEGLRFPAVRSSLYGVFINSDLYDKRNQRRIEITKQVFEKNRVQSSIINFHCKTKIEEAVASLTFSGYMTYWLALIHKIDPSKIPWVNFFKAELGRHK